MSSVSDEVLQSEKGEQNQGQEKEEQTRINDFKMVTFTLAGKHYGIDIMRVKEISKAKRFTYVPNTPPFVRGVFNLRGDIISIIDLRSMFHLPVEQKDENEMENMIILKLNEHIIGTVVDSIEKVIAMPSDIIQPPHPIFGDINIKYISGVVENENKLYLILDVDRIFSQEEQDNTEAEIDEYAEEQVEEEAVEEETPRENDLKFITESLQTFANYYVSPLNTEWVENRFETWKSIKREKGTDVQLKSFDDAEEFLSDFYSPYTGSFWGDDYMEKVRKILPAEIENGFYVWNPGCGKGYETYSLACILRQHFPENRVKIYANDADLMGISNAPSLVFKENEVPEQLKDYIIETKNGYQFNKEIKDIILFEYHDISNSNPYKDLDMIQARDLISFMKPQDQKRLINEFHEKLKENGLLILGQNEYPAFEPERWQKIEADGLLAYKKLKV